jgi:hypothetical protein
MWAEILNLVDKLLIYSLGSSVISVRKSPTFVSLSAGGARTASRPLGLDREEESDL